MLSKRTSNLCIGWVWNGLTLLLCRAHWDWQVWFWHFWSLQQTRKNVILYLGTLVYAHFPSKYALYFCHKHIICVIVNSENNLQFYWKIGRGHTLQRKWAFFYLFVLTAPKLLCQYLSTKLFKGVLLFGF